MENPEERFEYKIITGAQNNKFADLNRELNDLADQGWEVHQSCAASGGLFGLGTGGIGMGLAIILRRRKS